MIEGSVVTVLLLAAASVAWRTTRRLGGGRLAAGLLALVAAIVLVAVPLWQLFRSRSVQLFDTMVARVETDERVVALTFDDGPTPGYTEEVIETLARHDVRATFFLTGAEVSRNPEQLRRIAAAGHEIGNHSWSHPRMIFLSWAAIREEIESTDRAIRAAGYEGPIHFRSPFGKRFLLLPWYLHRTGRINVFFDVEPESYPDVAAEPEGITRHVLERARPGSIILLHVMYPQRQTTRDALPELIRELRARGFRFVTVEELLGHGRAQP